jgi:sulfatase maturation enzyme AslB (radical SAM superfamily)
MEHITKMLLFRNLEDYVKYRVDHNYIAIRDKENVRRIGENRFFFDIIKPHSLDSFISIIVEECKSKNLTDVLRDHQEIDTIVTNIVHQFLQSYLKQDNWGFWEEFTNRLN